MATKKKVVGISELNRRNVEAAMKLARLSIDNSQRVLSLHADLAKAIFEDTVANAKAHAKIRTPQDLVELNTKYVQATAKRVIEVARKVSGIANQSRNEFSRVLTAQMVASKSELTEAVQKLVSNLPAGTPDVNKAVDQALSAANSAFEQLSKVSGNALNAVGIKKPAAKPVAKKVAATKKAAVKKVATAQKAAVKKVATVQKAATKKAVTVKKAATKQVAAARKVVTEQVANVSAAATN